MMWHRAARTERRVRGAAVLMLGFIFANAAASAESRAAKPGSAYSACMGSANSTRDMQACQTAGLAAIERQLAAAVADTLAVLAPDQKATPRAAQRRWDEFRRADCRVYFGKEAGSMATIAAGECMIRRAHDRIEELRDVRSK